MNVEIVKEGKDIFSSILAKLVFYGVDFSKNLIVFPGKRPSYFLIDRIKNKTNSSFIPPIIFSIDEFIDHCYEKELGIFDKKIDALSGCKILREITKSKNLYNKEIEDTNAFLPYGLKLYSTLEELLIEDISKERLRQEDYLIDISNAYGVSEGLSDYLNNFKRLSDIYEKFYKTIENKNLSTRSMRYKKVSDSNIKLDGYERIIFAGFFALTECERKLFSKFYNDGRAVFIFQGESAQRYVFDRVYEPGSLDIDKIELYECPDTHSEVFKVSELLDGELSEKRGKESFLILAPSSDAVIPLIKSLNLELNKDYNVSLGYPLIRTPLYSFIKHIGDIFETIKDNKVYIPDYLKFILHPYTKNILIKNTSEYSRIIFHTLEEKLSKDSYVNYRSLEELESASFLDGIEKLLNGELRLDEVRDFIVNLHKNTIYKFLEIENIKDFAKKLKELINFVYERTTAKKHILFFPYCEAFVSALIDLENSLFADEKFNNAFEYFEFLKKFISLYNVPFHGTPLKDIQVLGFLESRNLKFDNVYIIDMNEGIIPNSEREDELLPFDVRKRLHIPTYLEKDILFEYYLNNLISGAKKVSLFYVENDNREKSRLIEKIIWEKQKRVKNLNDTFINTISYNISLSPYKPKEIEKTVEIKAYLKTITYSASAVDTYYNCPLKFYYQYVLLPDQRDEIIEDLGGHDVGQLIHEILNLYFSDKKIDFDEKKFANVIDQCFAKSFGGNVYGRLLILKYQIREKLTDFIKGYKNFVNANQIELLELEKEYKTDITIPGIGKINIKGKIDRIEKRDGVVFVVDYKKASKEDKYKFKWKMFDPNKRDEWQKSFKSIQLMFYIFLLVNHNECKEKPLNGSYFLLEKKDLTKSEIRLFNDETEIVKNSEFIDFIIIKLIEEIISEDIFTPTEDLKNCDWCNYKNICWQ